MLSATQIAFLHEVHRDLETAGRGRKGQIVRHAASMIGVSEKSLYRHLKTLTGYGKERKARSDAGQRSVSRELCLTVSGLVVTATRANGKKTKSIKSACENLARQGYGVVNPETGEVTMPDVSTVCRAMKMEGCHPVQLAKGTPSVTMKSLGPNDVWELDASVCVLYYLHGGKKVALMDERKYNEKKPGNLVDIGNYRVIRYVVVDHTSHYLYVRYELARGEDAKGVIGTLINAMSDRGPQDPMHGRPSKLYIDLSGPNQSAFVKDFCAALDINLLYHKPGNARATGSVEVAQNIVECEFESRLKFMEVPSLEALQEQADKWRMHFNARKIHSRLKCTRTQAWLRIANDQLVTADREVLEAMAVWKPITRQISPAFTISVDTKTSYGVQEYDLRALGYAGLNHGDSVSVQLNPFNAPAITVIKRMPDGTEKRWEALPIEKDEFGFPVNAPAIGVEYKSLPESAPEKALKEIKALAFPPLADVDADNGAAKAKPLPFAHLDPMADVREAPVAIRKPGHALELSASRAAPMDLTLMQAIRRLRAADPAPWEYDAAACNAKIRELHGDTVPESAIDTLRAELRKLMPVTGGLNYAAALDRAAGLVVDMPETAALGGGAV